MERSATTPIGYQSNYKKRNTITNQDDRFFTRPQHQNTTKTPTEVNVSNSVTAYPMLLHQHNMNQQEK